MPSICSHVVTCMFCVHTGLAILHVVILHLRTESEEVFSLFPPHSSEYCAHELPVSLSPVRNQNKMDKQKANNPKTNKQTNKTTLELISLSYLSWPATFPLPPPPLFNACITEKR